MSSPDDDDAQVIHMIQGMLGRERLAIDQCDGQRTTFLTHIGAQPRLVPGPWIAHRQLVMALALANLNPAQRSSLAHAVIVEWGREFGVGRQLLEAHASGLPLGGSSLAMRPRSGQPRVLYTWSLGLRATPVPCDWLLLRAQPEWSLDRPPRPIGLRGLETLAQLGGSVLLLVPSAVAARQIADIVADLLPLNAHPRFLPYLERHDPEASLLLWPHDAFGAASLERHRFSTALLIGAPEQIRLDAQRWAAERPGVEVVDAACPGRMDRKAMFRFWQACGRPKILLRGDAEWAAEAIPWLRSQGAIVHGHSEATQLGLF